MTETKDLFKELLIRCNISRTREARELSSILNEIHFKSLLEIHDEVAKYVSDPDKKHKKKQTEEVKVETPSEIKEISGEMMRMVGIRKKGNEPLGLTVS